MAPCALLLFASLLVTPTDSTSLAGQLLLVDDFEDVQNHLGGYRNPFQRAPSRASASRVVDQIGRPGVTRRLGWAAEDRCVRIHGLRGEDGYCGYWLHLFDFKSPTKQFLDAQGFKFLSFWVRGERGNESFQIKVADRLWIEKDDSLAIGSVAEFLPGGVTTQWREVLVPLDRLTKLDRHELGGVTIEFDVPGNYVVYLDDVCFKTAAQTVLPSRNTPTTVSDPTSAAPRKLWVWNSENLLLDPRQADELLNCCRDQGIDEIWMQLIYGFEETAEHEPTSCPSVSLRHVDRWRDFLRRSHARGIRVHALDGAAHYSQRTNHWIPLAVVNGVIDFNRKAARAERFDGVHFDNEPYLLVGWIDPELRQEILGEFLELNAECQRRVNSESAMKFGIDIPFWWQETDAKTGRPIGDVLFRGKRQAASYHCIEMLDNVGVMNYRDTADGADGMIAHGRDLLAFADRCGGAKVLMGVETFRSRPTPACFAAGLPREAFFRTLRSSAKSLARQYTLLGFRLRTLDDGSRIHIGIEIPRDSLPARKHDAQRALLQLGRQAGIRSQGGSEPSIALTEVANFVDTDGQWSDLKPMTLKDHTTGETYQGFRLTHTMYSKITFADDSPAHFVTEARAAETYFERYTSFDGMAVHYYGTLRKLLQAARQPSP